VVVRAELDDEIVGDEDLAVADDGTAVVGFPLERLGDLDRLDFALEHLREGALDEPTETPLEALHHSHEASLPLAGMIVSSEA
jgi:hypothetical protein